MSNDEKRRAVERFHLALDLYQAGEDLMRQNLRRRHVDASTAEIEARLVAWLQHRPGAEHGDAEGRPVPWVKVGQEPA